MKIDPKTANRTDSNYRKFTVRQAIDNALRDHLSRPHTNFQITSAVNTDGTEIPLRTLQMHIRKQMPDNWKVFTETEPDGSIMLWRVR